MQHPLVRGRNPHGRKWFNQRLTRPRLSNTKGTASRNKQTVLGWSTKAPPVALGLLTTTALCLRNQSSPSSRRGPVLPMPGPGRTTRAMAPRWRTVPAVLRPDASAASSPDTASSRGCWVLWCNSPPISRRTQATRCVRWCSRFW